MLHLSDVPTRLVGGVLVAGLLLALFSGVLAWHGLRRLMDVPRVPRPRAMYLVLAAMWGLTATACAATAIAVLLLRDHQRLDGRTQIGQVRCEPATPGHVRLEVTAASSSTSSSTPERYDIAGDSCTVSVREMELRPGLQALGLSTVARVHGVGPSARPEASPAWLIGSRLLGLVVRRTQASSVVVPADSKQRFVLFATPGHDVVLEPARI
jgi:hypothetical protein